MILEKILQNIQGNMMMLDRLAQISVKEGDINHAKHLAQCSQKEMELFGMWNYSALIVSFGVAVSQKDITESVAILGAMFRQGDLPE